MDEEEAYNLLLTTAREAGGIRALGRLWELSPSYISELVDKQRPITDTIADKMGLERIVTVTYRQKEGFSL